ncbi:MAG: hypothetical protein JWM68_4449 [Verrucomicrobiales bacterium]|nr:hypothetical protein [Verrucomicrobiales bacterium]
MRLFCFALLWCGAVLNLAANAVTNTFLPTMPAGYFLHAYDDCGMASRQPHVRMNDCYFFTFSTSDTDAGIKERTAVFSYKGISAVYTNLDPKLSYILALTYASDHVYHRVQSLEADGVKLHEPYALPQAKATRVLVKVPAEVTQDGKMTLSWKIHGEVNATVSIIELWANAPTAARLEIASISGVAEGLEGRVLDLAYEGVAGANVSLGNPAQRELVKTTTDTNGFFNFSSKELQPLPRKGEWLLTARHQGGKADLTISTTNLFFEPVHYRPLPEKTAGLKSNVVLLNGDWKIHPKTTNGTCALPLNDTSWATWQVPGQWLQQGFDIPRDQSAAVAKEFVIPKEWAGRRIILRFDSIHAGTRYWLNGQELGYSENLFTPVEWDITASAHPGTTNRLDLAMKLGTVSEAMSFSSDYAFHNLGGIDRSVRVFALPTAHVRQLHLSTDLDAAYRDADLQLHLELESGADTAEKLSLAVELQGPDGKTIRHSNPEMKVEAWTGTKPIDFTTHVANPLKWSAEKPDLYRLVLELRQGRTVLERVERNIGFRKVEIRNRQFLINGKTIKLAGACHHEYDPLTGRAATARHAETDVRLLKDANLNYIRTSHYPPTQERLDAADRLGMYVEVEAPFCWVGGALDDAANLHATLTPTSAMIDFCHSHPSVILWSIANESHFNRQFLASTRLCKELDPTRPTTFNFDFANNPLAAATDIANWHYPSVPYEKVFGGDPRPVIFGEYFFPICHEQTDVRIDPGLRELWGHGHAETNTAFSRAAGKEFLKPPTKPGLFPGGWSSIYHSDHMIGGAIWASHDDAFYFANGKTAGYAWHHGFWGLIDGWRRPKPEWDLARHIFSPVWLETRHPAFVAGQKSIRLPVENRFAFTDFSELHFRWEIGGKKGEVKTTLAPGARGEMEIPIPTGTAEGSKLQLRAVDGSGRVVNESLVQLGAEQTAPLPRATAGAPSWREEGDKVVITGTGFGLVFDRTKGEFDAADPRHTAAVISFPTAHVTRYDFGDLNGANSPPYAVFPEPASRKFEKMEIKEESSGLRLTVHEHFEGFAGSMSWLMDKEGRGVVSCDYIYSGKAMDTREAGIRFLLKPACDELKWKRWSEWGVFPKDSICRTEGLAKAHRDKKLGEAKWNERPAWPWALDETELGTTDFRSIKFNIYEASLGTSDGSGLSAHGNADVHFRSALTTNGVAAHVLSRCPLGQVPLNPGDHLAGEFIVQLHPPHK